jgi:hypothetical protein
VKKNGGDIHKEKINTNLLKVHAPNDTGDPKAIIAHKAKCTPFSGTSRHR